MIKLLALPVLAVTLALTACGKPAAQDDKLVVAATAVPHAEILEVVKPLLAEQGLSLEVRVFNDYVQPNDQLVQGQVDVNYFQTEPYLDAYNADRGTALVTVTGTARAAEPGVTALTGADGRPALRDAARCAPLPADRARAGRSRPGALAWRP